MAWALLLCWSLAAVPSVRADSASDKAASQQLMQRYERAVRLYNTGQYDKAIEEFQSLYEARPQPILMFNLAQAHRKAGHVAQALDLYERFLGQNTDPNLKTETEGYLVDLRKQAEEAKAAEKAAAEKAAAEKAAEDALAQERRKKYGWRRPLNIAKWSAVGVGVGLIVSGAVLMALDGRPVCAEDMPIVMGQKLCPEELDTKGAGIGLLIGGGVALGGAAGLFVLDHKAQKETEQRATTVALNFRF
jgi:tetratricopeptide (TPR) repeat protein